MTFIVWRPIPNILAGTDLAMRPVTSQIVSETVLGFAKVYEISVVCEAGLGEFCSITRSEAGVD